MHVLAFRSARVTAITQRAQSSHSGDSPAMLVPNSAMSQFDVGRAMQEWQRC